MQQYQKLDQAKKNVEEAQKQYQQKQTGSTPTRLFAKRNGAPAVAATSPVVPQSPVRESPNEYTIEMLDEIIKTNLARLEQLKSPQGKVPPRSPGGTLINNLSHVQPSVFQFADQLNMSQESVTKGAISKSWDSPRKNNSSNGDGRPVSRKSRLQTAAGSATKSSEDPFPAAPAAVTASAEKKQQKRTLDINLSVSAASVGNTTTTSAAVKPARSSTGGGAAGGKRPATRSQSGDILLSMDSSIESDEGDYELPGKTSKKSQPQPSPQPRKMTRRMSNGSNGNQRPPSKERSAQKPVRGSLHAPTVAATMRSLAVAGNSNDAKIKQQSKNIHKTVIQEDSKNPKKKKASK